MRIFLKIYKKLSLTIFFLAIFTFSLFGEKIPAWYINQNTAYPPDFYITAVGEGKNREEAEINAISTISKYFQISTETYDYLSKQYNQIETDDFYKFSETTEIKQKATITSKSDFFCVQFAQGFIVDGKFTTLAYINRDDAFEVYRQRIKLNENSLRSLLLIAEDYNNPVFGYEAAYHGLPIADMTEQLIKMAKLVQKTPANYFVEVETYIERIKTSYQICKTNLVFQVKVENDYEEMVERTVSSLLESNGYAVSKKNGICEIPVKITIDKEETSAGIFLYCGISIKLTNGVGEDFFSYSRSFPKKGAKNESMAYRRAFQEIEKELNSTFIDDFSKVVRLYE